MEWGESRLRVVTTSGRVLGECVLRRPPTTLTRTLPQVEGPLREKIRVPQVGVKWDSCETRWYVEDDTFFVLQLEKADKTRTWGRLFTAEHYVALAEAGNTVEQMNRAIQLDQKGDAVQAMHWWLRAADEGNNAHAQVVVGAKYQEGAGCDRDEDKSKAYYIKAATNASPHPIALITVGWWMREGSLGAAQDMLLGYTYLQLWETCATQFPQHKQGVACAQLLASEYLNKGDFDKAQRFAHIAGIKLEAPAPALRASPSPAKGRATRLEPLPRSDAATGAPASAAASGPRADVESSLSLWRRLALGTMALAVVAAVVRNYQR